MFNQSKLCPGANARTGTRINRLREPIVTMAIRVIGMAATFGGLALVGNLAEKDVLGRFIILSAMTQFGGSFLSLGLPTLFVKSAAPCVLEENWQAFASLYKRYFVSIMRVSALAALMLAALNMIWPGGKGGAGSAIEHVDIWSLAGSVLASAPQLLVVAALRSLRRPFLAALAQFVVQPLLFVGILALSSKVDGWPDQLVVSLGFMASMVISFASLHGYLQRRLSQTGRQPNRGMQPTLIDWNEARSVWLVQLLNSAAFTAPLMLGGLFLSASEVAEFGVPYRLANVPLTIVVAMGGFYGPRIREAYLTNDSDTLRRTLHESQLIGAATVLPLLLAAMLLPEFLLQVFGLSTANAVLLLRLFSVAQVLIAACGVSELCLIMMERTSEAMRVTAWCTFGVFVTGACAMYSLNSFAGGATWIVFSILRHLILCYRSHQFTMRTRTIESYARS